MKKHLLPIYFSGIVSMLLSGCVGSHTIQLHELPNYQANVPQIVFMDFKITKSTNNDEKVILSNAIIGTGEMRAVTTQPETAVQIKVVLKGPENKVLSEWFLDHPLHRQFEVMSENGQLERRELDRNEAIFSLRFQQNTQQQNVELYRVEADKKVRKIFNIILKP